MLIVQQPQHHTPTSSQQKDNMKDYSFLAEAAPSDRIPSHPVTRPASSSTFPYPDAAGSRFSVAARRDALAWALSCSPEEVQACDDVSWPIAAFSVVSIFLVYFL